MRLGRLEARLFWQITGVGLCLNFNGCAVVDVHRLRSSEYVTERRTDIIGSDRVSDRSLQALTVVGTNGATCEQVFNACVHDLLDSSGLSDEQRLSALSELWLLQGLKTEARHSNAKVQLDDQSLNAFLESARYAYAYLFDTTRRPTDRTFEERQLQVTQFYNFAVQHAISGLFNEQQLKNTDWQHTSLAGWDIARSSTDIRLAGDAPIAELIPAGALRFGGVRNIYERDGFGCDFVAVAHEQTMSDTIAWREPQYASLTGLLIFDGKRLSDILSTRQVRIVLKDPYRNGSVVVAGERVPLAANFTAPYGLWLARSGFAGQSIRSLLGREGGITTPRVLMMQPYDPDRLVVVMLHGLASSPEAWINVSNEVMGDEELRRDYQVWEVYYPTNAAVAVNLAAIRKALDATLRFFDPSAKAHASNNMVVIGHSMGGIIARLLVSSSGDELWKVLPLRPHSSVADEARLHARLGPYLNFKPMPQVTRAIFIAAPHNGTPIAQGRLARWIGNLIHAPATLLKELSSLAEVFNDDKTVGAAARVPNSIDNLSDKDPFIRAAANLPIDARVHYHSIIGVYKSRGSLPYSNDGVVPYSSAHLEGAESELTVTSWHSVQETPAAILEIRRILSLHAHIVDPEVSPQ